MDRPSAFVADNSMEKYLHIEMGYRHSANQMKAIRVSNELHFDSFEISTNRKESKFELCENSAIRKNSKQAQCLLGYPD